MKNLATNKAKTAARNTAVSVLLSLLSSAALAGTPFGPGTNALTSEILAIITPIVGLGLIAVGVLAWFGKIAWSWFAGLVVGIVLVFGHAQIVSFIRGIFSV